MMCPFYCKIMIIGQVLLQEEERVNNWLTEIMRPGGLGINSKREINYVAEKIIVKSVAGIPPTLYK